jgi:hypothetical protein
MGTIQQMNNNINLNMIHSHYRVEVKNYDAGHGGPVPPDYIVTNDIETVCQLGNSKEAESICKTYNEMRIMLLEQLLKEAKER